MKYYISILFFFVSLFSLYSCANNNNKVIADFGNANHLSITRFDADLYNYLEVPDSVKREMIKDKYGDFLNAFGSVTVNNPDYNSANYFTDLEKFFSNDILFRIYTDVESAFSDLSAYENQLTQANILIGKYFNEKQLPQLYMHVSGFRANTIVLQDVISISADLYMGSDYKEYQPFFAPYQLQQKQAKMIVRDYLKAWLIGELSVDNKRKDLLSEMLYQGKLLYALSQLLPEWSHADLLGYTSEQIDWAENKEKNIWKATIQNNQLFSSDYMTIVKYMDEAPYTATISVESPGRLGAWIGWQIINKYMENTQSDLTSLFGETDSQKILKASKYNP